jgi:hypothetical protein
MEVLKKKKSAGEFLYVWQEKKSQKREEPYTKPINLVFLAT